MTDLPPLWLSLTYNGLIWVGATLCHGWKKWSHTGDKLSHSSLSFGFQPEPRTAAYSRTWDLDKVGSDAASTGGIARHQRVVLM